MVSSQRRLTRRRALTCPFKQSNPSMWSLLSWHPTHTHLWVRLSVFFKLFVSTVMVQPSDLDYVNRSASLQQFQLIHPCRARRSRSDQGGHQYQALVFWFVSTGSFYSARGVVLQASASAAEHEARSRAGKILTTVADSPPKSVSCRWGSLPAVFWIFVCSYLLDEETATQPASF